MMSKNLLDQLPLLEAIASFSERCQKSIINEAKRRTIQAIIEMCRSVSSGTFNFSRSDKIKLKPYRSRIKKLAKREKLSKNLIVEKQLINHRGNIDFLSKVIAIAINNLKIPHVEKTKSSFDILKLKCHILQMQSYLNDFSYEIGMNNNNNSDDFNSLMTHDHDHDDIV